MEDHNQSNSTAKAEGPLQKRKYYDCKRQRVRTWALRLYILVMSETTSRPSHQHEQTKSTRAKLTCEGMGVGEHKASPYIKNQGVLKLGEQFLIGKSTPTSHSIPKSES